MPAGTTLTDFTSLFVTNDFKGNDDISLKHFSQLIIKVAGNSSYEINKAYSNLSPNLSDDQQFRLKEHQ